VIRYLLDTNVISETTRPSPDVNVTRWLGKLASITLPSIAVYELASGIQRLAAGRKRWSPTARCCHSTVMRPSVVPSWNRKRVAVVGRSSRDLLILAIAKSQELGIATRNVAHFRGFGVPLYDPFSDNQAL
jgi:predicted nucleic acid-binding protein